MEHYKISKLLNDLSGGQYSDNKNITDNNCKRDNNC